MILEFKPLDTLFFRDGKPFNKNEETIADALFPPFPATLYGALRTAYFDMNITVFEKLKTKHALNTSEDPTTALVIKNIVLTSGEDVLFSTPRNLLQNKDEFVVLDRLQSSALTKLDTCHVFVNDSNDNFKYLDNFINEINFGKYLAKSYSRMYAPQKYNLFTSEPKIGIALNPTNKTADDECLYRIDLLRLQENIRILVDVDGLDFGETTVAKLGGEGKYVAVKKSQTLADIPMPDITDSFLIYLNTPAIFRKGWLPGWIDEETLIGTIPNTNLKVKLTTAIIGKPKLIGGFDMAKGKPKPMFKAVPSGSIYFFEIIDGEARELQKIHQKSISDVYPEQGFGVSYIGLV